MAKNPITDGAAEDQVETVASIEVADIALDDWCAQKSRELGRRVEAMSAFYRKCLTQGVGRATVDKFEADFQAFLNEPA